MWSIYALSSGALFVILALLEVLVFRGPSVGVLVFSPVHNALQWSIGLSGIALATWFPRACRLFAWVVALCLLLLAAASLFAPALIRNVLGEMNALYGIWYLMLGLVGLWVGFTDLRSRRRL